VTWGINSGAFSIFLSFYQENNYFPGATTLQFTFIGGLSLSLAMAVGPVSNWIAKGYGFRTTFALGTLFLCSGQILSGFATRIWMLFITQGVLFGFGLGFVRSRRTPGITGICANGDDFAQTMVSTSPISAQWFGKKRALALVSISHLGFVCMLIRDLARASEELDRVPEA
jgi:MFS family permease